MSRLTTIHPEFVESVPRELEEGILYVSILYGTTVHKCACGCGNKITLPINPAKWRLLWDGERISLWPSIGNWSYPCHSHYWIEQNHIEWAPTLSREKITAIRRQDKKAREGYLARRADLAEPTDQEPSVADKGRGLVDRIRGLLRR